MKEFKSDIKRSYIISTLLVIGLLILCFYVGYKRIYFSDFNPINGDFQNYNGYRRLLEGQVPFGDFNYYLGLGPLYLNAIILSIVGNTFTNSLFVTNFSVVLIFEIIAIVLVYLIVKNRNLALSISLLISTANVIKPEWFVEMIDSQLMNALSIGVSPGNSMRIHRGFLPFIIIIVGMLYIKQLNKGNKFFVRIQESRLNLALVLGFFSGCCIIWSNDYGIASYIVFSLLFGIFLLKKHRFYFWPTFKYTIIYIISSVFGWFICVNIFTLGNYRGWLRSTFGTSEFQSWYYGTSINEKTLYIHDLNTDVFIIIAIGFIVYYLYKYITDKYTYFELGLLFCISTCLLNGYIYQIVAGGQCYELLYIVIFIIITTYMIKGIVLGLNNTVSMNNKIHIYTYVSILIVCMGYIITPLKEEVVKHKESRGYYVDELNGYLSSYGESLEYTKEIIGDNQIFSTYASAFEVMLGQYQPTGTDYIIHVLGDEVRDEYLSNFISGQYPYVATIREDFTKWEHWVKRANWFFYRELYKEYVPKFTTDYSVIWEKGEVEKISLDNSKVEVINRDNQSYEIKIKVGGLKGEHIADVKLNYVSKWNNRGIYNLNRFVEVVDTQDMQIESYFLPHNSEGYSVPIRLYDGEGSIIIKSTPYKNTQLTVNDAEIENIYIEPMRNIVQMNSLSDSNWEKGISKHSNEILFNNVESNLDKLLNGRQLRVGNTVIDILSIYYDSEWIRVRVNADFSKCLEFTAPNLIKVIS